MQTNLAVLDEDIIKDKIYLIRGQYVMLDFDLAKIYGYTTKAFNQQVKNNIEKFDDDFMFKLDKEEIKNISRSKNLTLKNNDARGRNIKYNPSAFTEEGIYMLMTVLKGELAIKQSKTLIRIFKNMKNYLLNNSILNQEYINNMVLSHENKIEYIDNNLKLLQYSFDKLQETKNNTEIYFNGQIYDAYSKILDIFKEAKNEIIVIDTYADNTLLDIIKRLKVNVTIITKCDNLLTKQDIIKYNKQYSNLKVIYNNTFHDRYFILDEKQIYHCGASINKIGYKTFSINVINDIDICDKLLSKIKEIL